MKRVAGLGIGPVFVAVAVVGAAAAPAAPAAPCEGTAIARPWNGPDGKPLPFACDEEVVDFLRTARVVSRKELSSGSTRPLKLRLEKDGVEANAIFRHIDIEKRGLRLADGSFHHLLTDSYRLDVAAYELARLLGMTNVPPATLRELDGREGGIQLWLEDVTTEGSRLEKHRQPPSQRAYAWQLRTMQVWDALIANIDRNKGNILVDAQWRVWLIDHTRSFARHEPDQVLDASLGVDDAFLGRLRDVTDAELKATLDPYLDPWQLAGLLERRARLVAAFAAAVPPTRAAR